MFSKIQKKILGIKCTVDILECEDDIITLKGWLFSEKNIIENVRILFIYENKDYTMDVLYGIKREDVFQAIQHERAYKCGFFGQYIVDSMKQIKVWITFDISGKTYKIYLGEIKCKAAICENNPPRIIRIDLDNDGLDIIDIVSKYKRYQFQFPENLYSECIDIIIPVYNGFQFLDKLLKSISLTKMRYRLILINDKSTDQRVCSFLEEYAEGKNNVILLNNEENMGFVKTVNRGFQISENHIALVNTDVELPEFWLERLMLPILTDAKVASSTPYTNCGTICSFPEFAKDNDLFLGLNVSEIDEEFIKIKPIYQKIPTGVGFCMGVNRNVLEEIGGFDAENFGKGYGEENDWCQRAEECGYKNVHVENLFVYHKHGGSFLSEEKKRLLQEHEKNLLDKHPYYNKDVARYCALDPNKHIREFVKLNLLKKGKKYYTILALDHSLGGGATKYLNERKDQNVKEGKAFVIVRFDLTREVYRFSFFYQEFEIKFYAKCVEDFIYMLDYITVDEIWINEMVTYPELYDMLCSIKNYSQEHKVGVRMLVHDFFSVCPTVNLLNWKGNYCGIPEYDVCNECLEKASLSQSLNYESMQKWRKEWRGFLEACKEVIVFSNDSKNIIEKAFGELNNIIVRPHQIAFLPKVEKKYKTTDSMNIGLLGVLTKHKGRVLVNELINLIEKEKLNIKIVLIGSATQKIKSPIFRETGRYSRESLPKLILENDIDIFLIPSIWPETFSYTTEEIMKLGMPIMCFDIGAPAERVKLYDKGVIIPEISPEAVLKILKKDKRVLTCMDKKILNRKILFVVEEITFSSRYRVEHLREQLIQKGIASDCYSINEAHKKDLFEYASVVVYRSSEIELTQKLVKNAHKHGKKVYYDMDDYIFEYEKIRNLKFLQGKDYNDFEHYSNNIQKCMSMCDGYIVSTTSLREAICRCFPEKSVVINRNVASMEMVTISLDEIRESDEKIIRLGYFSGSKTHDEDFNRIKNTILTIMKKNGNVHLVVGGQIELSADFDELKDRIEKFEFVSWRKLPSLIANVDINLMPLEETFFHECKSENKWMEAALVKVPTIASWNHELANVIESGVTGYLCRENVEWEENLQKLIQSRELRNKIAENAHKRVLERYTVKSVEQEVIDLLIR